MNQTTQIKVAHLVYCLLGGSRFASQIAARIFGLRAHWVRNARECGYSFI